MTGWHEGPLLSLDFETSGVDVSTCRVVQAGLARIAPGEGAQMHLWLLNPGMDFEMPAGAQAVHGISTERCWAEGKDPAVVLAQIADTVEQHLRAGHPLIAFNAAYDCTLLEVELDRHSLPTITERLGHPFGPVIDPFVLDKHLSYRKGSRKLVDQCAHYGVRIDGAHDAGHDALAAARVAWRLAQQHPKYAEMPLAELHQLQIGWAAAQAESLRAYFDRKGTAHDGIDGTWPIRHAALVAA